MKGTRVGIGALAVVGCAGAACMAGGGRVSVIGHDEQPVQPSERPTQQVHAHNDSTIELPSDEEIVEPDHPAVGSTQERALAHVHTSRGVCSGVVVAPRVVVTAHQCLGEAAGGITAVAPNAKLYVEVATSTLTWTRRQVSFVVTPSCVWEKLDVAALVLAESIEWVKPLKVTTLPPPGQTVQALGYGRCSGETRGIAHRKGQLLRSEGDAFVIDLSLCKGDIGGPVVDEVSGDLLGVISHQDDPDDAPRHTTTIERLDSTPARAVVAQAVKLAASPDGVKLEAVACE